MPLVDGRVATRLIREWEQATHPKISQNIISYDRIPIIAVSASLSEQSRQEYMDGGFSGWILKPIDFTRLEAIIAAIQDEKIRRSLIYPISTWAEGGWFKFNTEAEKRQSVSSKDSKKGIANSLEIETGNSQEKSTEIFQEKEPVVESRTGSGDSQSSEQSDPKGKGIENEKQRNPLEEKRQGNEPEKMKQNSTGRRPTDATKVSR